MVKMALLCIFYHHKMQKKNTKNATCNIFEVIIRSISKRTSPTTWCLPPLVAHSHNSRGRLLPALLLTLLWVVTRTDPATLLGRKGRAFRSCQRTVTWLHFVVSQIWTCLLSSNHFKAFRVTYLNANMSFSICFYMHRKMAKTDKRRCRGRAFTGLVTGAEGGERKSLFNSHLLFLHLLQ